MKEKDDKKAIEITDLGPQQQIPDYGGLNASFLQINFEPISKIAIQPVHSNPREEVNIKTQVNLPEYKELPKVKLVTGESPNEFPLKNSSQIQLQQSELTTDAQFNINLSSPETLPSVYGNEQRRMSLDGILPKISEAGKFGTPNEGIQPQTHAEIPKNIPIEFSETNTQRKENQAEITRISAETPKTDNNLRFFETPFDVFVAPETGKTDKSKRIIPQNQEDLNIDNELQSLIARIEPGKINQSRHLIPENQERPEAIKLNPPERLPLDETKPSPEERKEIVVKLHPSTAFYLDGDLLRVVQ